MATGFTIDTEKLAQLDPVVVAQLEIFTWTLQEGDCAYNGARMHAIVLFYERLLHYRLRSHRSQ